MKALPKKFGCNRETSGDARCGIKDASDVEVWFWMGVSGFGWIDDRSGPSKRYERIKDKFYER